MRDGAAESAFPSEVSPYNRAVMRLITRCPACGTLFKVVPDQLRISEGWVRCGQCAEVFDATAHFHDPEASASGATDTPVSDAPAPDPRDAPDAYPARELYWADEPASAPLDEPVPAPGSIDTGFQPFDPPEVLESPSPDFEPHAETAFSSFVEPSIELPADVIDGPVQSAHHDGAHDEVYDGIYDDIESPIEDMVAPMPRDPESANDGPDLEALDDGIVEEAAVQALAPVASDELAGRDELGDDSPVVTHAAIDAAPQEPPTPAATPAFVRQADRKAFWRRPLVRVLMTLLLLCAAGVLALQLAYTQRERIGAYMPAARPALVQMCALLRCELGALRQIDAIVVDGSSFTRLRPDTYRLGVVLKNNAQVEIAMPSIELELSSVQGRTLVRRVLSPADMGASPTLAAGAEWIGEVPVALEAADVASRVAGYAVLPFYP